MVLVDTNVLLDLFTDDKAWRAWSERAIRDAVVDAAGGRQSHHLRGGVAGFSDSGVLDRHLDALMLVRLPLPYEAAFPAGRAFLRYRRAGGTRASPLPDFFIGAHAQTAGLTLLTRDASRYRTYFPNVRLVTPMQDA